MPMSIYQRRRGTTAWSRSRTRIHHPSLASASSPATTIHFSESSPISSSTVTLPVRVRDSEVIVRTPAHRDIVRSKFNLCTIYYSVSAYCFLFSAQSALYFPLLYLQDEHEILITVLQYYAPCECFPLWACRTLGRCRACPHYRLNVVQYGDILTRANYPIPGPNNVMRTPDVVRHPASSSYYCTVLLPDLRLAP